MGKIVCRECGETWGYYLDSKNVGIEPVEDSICLKCFEHKRHEKEQADRKAAALAKPLTDKDLIEAVEDWWGCEVNECFNEIEDDVLHDKVIARLREVLKLPE